MLNEVFDIATQGIPIRTHGAEAKDPLWPACLACAVVDRSRRAVGIALIDLDTGCVRRSEGARVVRAYTRGVEGSEREMEESRGRERGGEGRRVALWVV